MRICDWSSDVCSSDLPTLVRFGSGIIAGLPEEAAHMGLSRLLLLSTPQQVELAERASALLGAEAVAQFNQATMHTPVDVTDRAMEIVTTQQIASIVSLGGGSTIGLRKAIADLKSTRMNSRHSYATRMQ